MSTRQNAKKSDCNYAKLLFHYSHSPSLSSFYAAIDLESLAIITVFKLTLNEPSSYTIRRFFIKSVLLYYAKIASDDEDERTQIELKERSLHSWWSVTYRAVPDRGISFPFHSKSDTAIRIQNALQTMKTLLNWTVAICSSEMIFQSVFSLPYRRRRSSREKNL